MTRLAVLLAGVFLVLATGRLEAQPSLMEDLGRGVVAVRSAVTEVFVSWRMLGTDPPDIAFNVYRATAGAEPVRLNASPMSGPTHYVDGTADLAQPNAYFVRPILFGLEQPPSAGFTVPASAPVQPYLRVPLQVPPGGTTPAGESYTYSPNDTSAGDRLTLGARSFSTVRTLTANVLAGARCVMRSHVTLARLQLMLTPGLVGRDNSLLADAVEVLENGRAERYFLNADGVTWRKTGSTEDFRDKVLPPDGSFVVESKYGAQTWRHAGAVRTNAFRKNLVRGVQSFATGFPQDLSPVQIGAFVDPGAPPGTRWTGNNVFAFADQIQVLLGARPFELFYLRGNGSAWRTLFDATNAASSPILGATSLTLLRRVNPDGAFRILPPFVP